MKLNADDYMAATQALDEQLKREPCEVVLTRNQAAAARRACAFASAWLGILHNTKPETRNTHEQTD